MVRAIVSRLVRLCLLTCCFVTISGLTANSAFAAADSTKIVSFVATAETTGVTACDANANTKSCLGQRVDFNVTVLDQNPSGNGSPAGTVFFSDEKNVTIGSAPLSANS